jgi:hypothetical protein
VIALLVPVLVFAWLVVGALVVRLAGYWCLQCNNAGKGQRHECAGP